MTVPASTLPWRAGAALPRLLRHAAGLRVGLAGSLIASAGQVLPAVHTLAAPAQSASAAFADPLLLDGVCYGVIVGLMTYAMLMYLTFRDRMYVYFLLAAFRAR